VHEEATSYARAGRSCGGGTGCWRRGRRATGREGAELSEATYQRWRAQYGAMKVDDVKRLKELEAKNARLKRIVADQVLEVAALQEIGKGDW
jgi:hypothetical protein